MSGRRRRGRHRREACEELTKSAGIMDGAKEREARIQALEKQREEELESRRWMASDPDRPNSFGKYEFFEKKVNERFDNMIATLRRDDDDPSKRSSVAPVSPDDVSRRSKRRRGIRRSRQDDDVEMGSDFDDAAEDGDDEIAESSFSYTSSNSPNSEGDDDEYIASDDEEESDGGGGESDEDYEPASRSTRGRGSKRHREQEVIELDGSDSDSDSSRDEKARRNSEGGEDDIADDSQSLLTQEDPVSEMNGGEATHGSDPDSSPAASQRGSVDGDGNSMQVDESHQLEDSNRVGSDQRAEHEAGSESPSHHFSNDAPVADVEEENEMASSSNTFEPEDYDYADEGDTSGNIERYHVSKIQQSKLAMAAQGFRCHATGSPSSDAEALSTNASSTAAVRDFTPFDPPSVGYQGVTFAKNRCYVLKGDGEVIVGIQRFISSDTAQCVLVEQFENTLLGIEDEGLEYRADDAMMGTYVQVHKCVESISLSKLERESEEVTEIPQLIYQPQTPGG